MSTLQSAGSHVRRVGSQVYSAYANGRWPILDGPLWLALVVVAVVVALVLLGDSPWRWVFIPIGVLFVSVPLWIRWCVALWKSVHAFREELQGK